MRMKYIFSIMGFVVLTTNTVFAVGITAAAVQQNSPNDPLIEAIQTMGRTLSSLVSTGNYAASDEQTIYIMSSMIDQISANIDAYIGINIKNTATQEALRTQKNALSSAANDLLSKVSMIASARPKDPARRSTRYAMYDDQVPDPFDRILDTIRSIKRLQPVAEASTAENACLGHIQEVIDIYRAMLENITKLVSTRYKVKILGKKP